MSVKDLADQLAGLLGVAEIGRLLGVKAATVSQWRQRGLLPPPDRSIARADLWLQSTIEQWAKETRRPRRRGTDWEDNLQGEPRSEAEDNEQRERDDEQ